MIFTLPLWPVVAFAAVVVLLAATRPLKRR
jgi:hypothetical protein